MPIGIIADKVLQSFLPELGIVSLVPFREISFALPLNRSTIRGRIKSNIMKPSCAILCSMNLSDAVCLDSVDIWGGFNCHKNIDQPEHVTTKYYI